MKKDRDSFNLKDLIGSVIFSIFCTILGFCFSAFIYFLIIEKFDVLGAIISLAVANISLQASFLFTITNVTSSINDMFRTLRRDTYKVANFVRFKDDNSAIDYIISRSQDIRYAYNTRFSSPNEYSRLKSSLDNNESYSKFNNMIINLTDKGTVWRDIVTINNVSRFKDLYEHAKRGTPFDSPGYDQYSQTSDGQSKDPKNTYLIKVVDTSPRMNFIIIGYNDGTEEVIINWDYVKDNNPAPIVIRDKDAINSFRSHFNSLWDDYPNLLHQDNNPNLFSPEYCYTSKIFHFRTRSNAVRFIISKMKGSQLQSMHNVHIIAKNVPEELIKISDSEWRNFNKEIKNWLKNISSDSNNSNFIDNHYIEIIGEDQMSRILNHQHIYLSDDGESHLFDNNEKYLIYKLKTLDNIPIVNYVTMNFRDGRKVVLFGWGGLEGLEMGEVFATDNEVIVSFFETHFSILRKYADKLGHINEVIRPNDNSSDGNNEDHAVDGTSGR